MRASATCRSSACPFGQGAETQRVDVAALSTDARPINYQALVVAMDTAIKAGYPDVGVTDPTSLAR